MWAWCCRKLCPFCCCWCPYCCFCEGKDGDLAELITSAECPKGELEYYTVRKVASLRATTSQEDVDSSLDMPGYARTQIPPGNAREMLGLSPAAYWSPSVHQIQPDIDTSAESRSTPRGLGSKSRGRGHRAPHTLRPRCAHDEHIPLDQSNQGCGEGSRGSPKMTASAPDLAEMDSISVQAAKLQMHETSGYPDMSSVQMSPHQVLWMKSQSMHDVHSNRTSSKSKKVSDKTALLYGINTSLYSVKDPAHTKSNEALSAWRTCGEASCYPEPSYGEVQFTVSYLPSTKKLFVGVTRVNDLPPKGECYKYSVVLRLCVLPEERRTKMSCSVSGDLSPSFSDEFRFLVRKLEGRVLRISAYDADFGGRYDAIGHALFYLEDLPPGERTSYSMRLYKQSQPYQYPGSVEVSLHYDSRLDKLCVHVFQARNLALSPQVAHNWRSIDNFNTYVKVAYFCAGHKLKSKKSPQVANSRNPVYEFTSEFVLASNYPHEIYMVVTVLVPGLLRKDLPVGRVIFGPFYYADDRSETPWGRAVRHDQVVSHWYNLYL